MAGGGAPIPQKGGKKSVDFAVNLIPSIDLLSVLIAFLLITAVWTQIARVDTDQAISKSPDSSPRPPQQESRVDILLTSDEVVVKLSEGGPARRFQRGAGDRLLKEVRGALRGAHERSVEAPKVMLAAEDGVAFKRLVEVMDVCLDVGLSRITVATPSALGDGVL
jgi:biopolymer transport protein ExbD